MMDYIEVTDWQFDIPFQWLHDNYGRAEFEICPVWKRKRIVQLSIVTAQQVPARGWVWNGLKCEGISLGSYDKLDSPKVWWVGYCSFHKTQTLRIYVPSYSEFLHISVLSSFNVNFRRKV